MRIAKKVKFASQKVTTFDGKMKASIKAYGVAITAEELVKTEVTALRHKMDGEDEHGWWIFIELFIYMYGIVYDIFNYIDKII